MMFGEERTRMAWVLVAAITWLLPVTDGRGQEPPALNPFGTGAERHQQREDALPGFLELSDGAVHPGLLFLTRDARLKIFDEAQKRQREIPWKAIKQIDGSVSKEWVEKEWRFKENASDEKLFSGRTYPAREYIHKITLRNNQTIRSSLAGIVYVQADPASEPKRLLAPQAGEGRARNRPQNAALRPIDPARRQGPGRRKEQSGQGKGQVRERKRGSIQEGEGEMNQGMSLV